MAKAYGGLILYSALGISPPEAFISTVTAGAYTLVRNAIGDWSWNTGTAGAATVQFAPDDSNLARPYISGFSPYPLGGTAVFPSSNEFQEVFGTAAGGPSNPWSGIAPGSPTVAGAVQGNQFLTGLVPYGIALIDVFAVYSVQTAALTAATLSVNRNIFSENVATSNVAVVAPQTIALTTTTSATTPHVQKFALPQPLVFESADYSDLLIELSLTTAATSVVRVYGIGAHYAVRYA